MAKVISIGTCDAPYRLPQSEVRHFIHNLFSSYPEIDKMINVFDNSEIKERHFSASIEWLGKHHTFGERSKLYSEIAVKMAKKAIEESLDNAGVSVKNIDCIIMISSTGVVTPTLDAILFNELGLNKHIKRIPIWGLGCAGGVSGVSRAMDYVKANPSHNCLLVAVELCSLTFQKDDLTKSNIIAASLFSDGCAAVLISGKDSNAFRTGGIILLDSLSTIYDHSLDVMGWDVVDNGFRIIFSRDIPMIVRDYVKCNIEEITTKNNISISDIKFFVTHPGGMKVIKAYEKSLGLTNGTLKYSRKVLSSHGNMSAPSVLYVLKEFFKSNEFKQKGYGLLSSLGPGFSSELVLFKSL